MRKISGFPIFVSLVAALGGLLFGYNTSVISGALIFLTRDFALSVFQQEMVVSTLLIGALIGALAGGLIADLFGRKKTLFLTLVLFFIGNLMLTNAGGYHSLLWGRLIIGLAIGVASLAVPLYIAEISPRKNRGTLVSLNQLLITIGILVAYIVSYIYAERQEWREMFAFGYIPIIVQFIGLFFIPETPSWLYSRQKKAKADKILAKMGIAQEDAAMQEKPSSKNWRELLNPAVRKPFLIGIGISAFQQITGINTVIYYAPRIFESAGYQVAETAIFATMLIGCANVACTLIALWLIDRLGRRPLLIFGLIGMGASLAFLGFSFFTAVGNIGAIAAASLMAYVAFFAVSLGPVAWLIISEIYPLGIRGRAMGIATFANWTCNYLVSLTFLTLLHEIGSAATFWLYALICLFALWFVFKLVPETKGKTLKQIQHFWY